MKNQNKIIKIPDYTADQYMNTSLPYEWLYQYIDDKFIFQQLRERMKSQAGSLGVKAFIGLWNAYCESEAQKQGIELCNATDFEGQQIELFSGDYCCDECGVTKHDRYGYEQVVCLHPIMPVQRLVNIDNNEERLNIAFKKGSIWRNVIAEKTLIASSTSILNLAANGVVVNSDNAKLLSTYLLEIENLNYDEIPEQKSVSRLGWVGDHMFSPYVDNLVFDGESNYKHIFNAVKSHGRRQKWMDVAISIRSEKTAGKLFIAVSLASVILGPCGILPFFFHAWGESEVGKTVGLMVAASVWACPVPGEYITTFNSTIVGQEMITSVLNSLPMCMDELQIKSSSGAKNFDNLIYHLTEGIGRTRGAKRGGLQKINTWRNCIITNGEQPISNSASAGGAMNRVLEFECTEKICSDLIGVCEIIKTNYGFIGREFVEILQKDSNFEKIKELQKYYYDEALKFETTDKQAAAISAILAADHLATEYIFKDGNNLKIDDVSHILSSREQVNVNARAYDYILDLVAQNINKFMPDEQGNYKGEAWGKISADGDSVYIIKSLFDKEMVNAGFNPTSFLSWAKKNNRVHTSQGRRTRQTRIGGVVANCVCIIAESVKIPTGFEDDEDEEIPF